MSESMEKALALIPETLEKDILSESTKRAESTSKMAVSPLNASNYETVRTENNKYIKDIRHRLDEAREVWDKPFEERALRVLAALKPLEEANKTLANSILFAKKKAFEDSMRERWKELALANPDGEIVPFEDVFDPKWYCKTKHDAEMALAVGMRRCADRKTKEVVSLTIYSDRDTIRRLKEWLAENGATYEMEEM